MLVVRMHKSTRSTRPIVAPTTMRIHLEAISIAFLTGCGGRHLRLRVVLMPKTSTKSTSLPKWKRKPHSFLWLRVDQYLKRMMSETKNLPQQLRILKSWQLRQKQDLMIMLSKQWKMGKTWKALWSLLECKALYSLLYRMRYSAQ